MQCKRILIANTIGLGYEGITSVIKNYITAMERDELDLHFIAYSETPQTLKQYFGNYGTVYTLTDRKEQLWKYLRGLCQVLKRGFDVMHIHGNSGTMLIEVVIAKLYGVKNIIIHGHSTSTNHPVVNRILKAPMMRLADTCIACSKASGEWLYGNYPYTVLNNAIDLNRFRFSEVNREKYRDEFGIKDEFLVGHIGHFTPQKNHFFLIDIFFEFHKLEPNSKLLLISDGPRFDQVKAKVAELGMEDVVIFAGRRSDIAGIYSAMDLFILPSCWEGLPLVLVEAQASGLPVVASDKITGDVRCVDIFRYLSIDRKPAVWAENVLQLSREQVKRSGDQAERLRDRGFDIYMEAQHLREMYLHG